MTRDGRMLLYTQIGADERRQVFVLATSASGSRHSYPLHDAAATEFTAEVSPDNRWLAYDSEESGTRDVHVQSFSGAGQPTRISAHGGASPRWARDGGELFYWSNPPASRLTVVDMPPELAARPGAPRELFELKSGNIWDVTPDPERFLVELTGATGGSTIAMVTDWFEELRRRAPGHK
jgi:hypothetical protein